MTWSHKCIAARSKYLSDSWRNHTIEHFLFQVQSFGLSLGSGEKKENRRSTSRNCFKPTHLVLPTTASQIFVTSLLSRYSSSWNPPIFTLLQHNKAFHISIDFWLLLPIKTKLKEIMMAFVYKQNLIFIYSLHLIAKFINTDQTVLVKTIPCF